jgi:hypothetical protein
MVFMFVVTLAGCEFDPAGQSKKVQELNNGIYALSKRVSALEQNQSAGDWVLWARQIRSDGWVVLAGAIDAFPSKTECEQRKNIKQGFEYYCLPKGVSPNFNK